jgi:hypothetical protein
MGKQILNKSLVILSKVDEENYFELNYLQKGDYIIIAFEDENQNSVYDAGKEKVGF